MGQNEKTSPFRILMVITTPKIAEQVSKIYHDGAIPVHYSLNAKGIVLSLPIDIVQLKIQWET